MYKSKGFLVPTYKVGLPKIFVDEIYFTKNLAMPI